MKILIVDDDTMILKALSKFIEGQLGHDVTQCRNGNEALDALKRDSFPLVLTDIRMPGISGIELLDEIKKLPCGAPYRCCSYHCSWRYDECGEGLALRRL